MRRFKLSLLVTTLGMGILSFSFGRSDYSADNYVYAEESSASSELDENEELEKLDGIEELSETSESDELEESNELDDQDELDESDGLTLPEQPDVQEILGDSGDPVLPESGPHGSGSYQLNEVPDDYRYYTEYYVGAASGKSTTTAGIERRTVIHVYAKKDEVILFGSSVSDSQIDINNKYIGSVTGTDIVITTPNGTRIPEDVIAPGGTDGDGNLCPKGRGYIANPTQEKYGPMVNHADENDPEGKYYSPLQYKATEEGVYSFEFHSKTGYNDGTVPTPKKASDPNWNQNKTSVAAWDVTVLGKKTASEWEVKSGRAWADYLALTTGDAGTKISDLDVHVLTHDGYIYKVKFEKAVPYGFIFFANNTGFMTTIKDDSGHVTKSPIYHSFYDSTNDLDHMTDGENIILHKPNEADTENEETYKIFFNKPSDDLNNVTYNQNGSSITMKTKPDDNVTLSNLKFNGIGENLARSGHGGAFSFDSDGEAMVSLRLDLRKAIFDSKQTMDSYEGSGIVEITAPAHAGSNTFYWDGKDTDGVVVPAGIYGDQNVVLSSEVKRGELHFPVIDMEGLYGGLRVERINRASSESDESRHASAYNLYYNNNPLAFGTIEGKDVQKTSSGKYNLLSDGTKSYEIDSSKGGMTYFKSYLNDLSTLKKDDKEYLSKVLFNTSYSALDPDKKAIIDAEFGMEIDTYHYEPVNSQTQSMKFSCDNYNGGGNQAGIDAWTYYSQGVTPQVISFAVLDTTDRGLVKGQIFYDKDISSTYDSTVDSPLSNVKVRLIDSNGKPLEHKELLPCFDETGHFIYNEDGTVKHELRNVVFDTVTDAKGNYRFTGVPYSTTEDTTYYVQVMLTDVQSEVLRYTCTTSEDVKEKLVTSEATPKQFHNNTIGSDYGADGNKLVAVTDISKIYGHKYDRNTKTNETVFDYNNLKNVQAVTFSKSGGTEEHGIRVEEFKKIGYSTTVPSEHQKDYKLVKNWGIDSEGNSTHMISDGITVELWVWNDSDVKEENDRSLSRRTGALLDTQVLNEDNGWKYTWTNLDDRLQYYVLEYYTKKKPNGEIIYNDKQEPRMVLIGGTMPIFSYVPVDHKGIYGFKTNLGDYPETIVDPDDSTKLRIPIQKFGDGKVHTNSITKQEKLESVENNARQYDVKYVLTKEDSEKTNVITLTNSQVFDDRTYYVWLGHQTSLPDLISQTYVEAGKRKSHAVKLEKDQLVSGDEYSIKGLSVSSVDAAESDNTEGNATNAFRIKGESTSAIFTATDHGNYKTGTGTRTYQVKYVVEQASKKPVSVKANSSGKLVLADNESIAVEANPSYITYSWYMTIHVYDVESDGVIEYDPTAGEVNLQKALDSKTNLKWTLTHDGENYNSIVYKSNDPRTSGLLANDTYRLPLYKSAVDPDMGSCADVIGIAYAGSKPVDDVSKLEFVDTYESRYGSGLVDSEDGIAEADGSGGSAVVKLNTMRNTRINRTQDHANYADISFVPKKLGKAAGNDLGEDVFYYKIAVFGEDSTYQFYNYDDIDASEGVVMYTYFVMKPNPDLPDEPTTEEPTTEEPTTEEPTTEAPTTEIPEGNMSDNKGTPAMGDEMPYDFACFVLVVSVCLLGVVVVKLKKYLV